MTTTTHTAETVTLPEGVADTAPIRATYAALLNGVTGSPAKVAAESGVVVARTRAALNALKGAGIATVVEATKVGEAALWSLVESDVEPEEIELQELATEPETVEEEDEFEVALSEMVGELAPQLDELATAWDSFPKGEEGSIEHGWYKAAEDNANLTAEEQGFPARSEQWFECAVATYYSAQDERLDAYNGASQETVPAPAALTPTAKKRIVSAAIIKLVAEMAEGWDATTTGVTLAEVREFGGLWMSYMPGSAKQWDERLGEFPIRK